MCGGLATTLRDVKRGTRFEVRPAYPDSAATRVRHPLRRHIVRDIHQLHVGDGAEYRRLHSSRKAVSHTEVGSEGDDAVGHLARLSRNRRFVRRSLSRGIFTDADSMGDGRDAQIDRQRYSGSPRCRSADEANNVLNIFLLPLFIVPTLRHPGGNLPDVPVCQAKFHTFLLRHIVLCYFDQRRKSCL